MPMTTPQGADIPYVRLHAQPSAARCVACQAAAER